MKISVVLIFQLILINCLFAINNSTNDLIENVLKNQNEDKIVNQSVSKNKC